MKKLLVAILFIQITAFIPSGQTVYICKGPESKRYHFSANCRGLSNCSTRIYEVPLEEAEGLGRTICGWED